MNPQTHEILTAALALVRKGWCADAYAKNAQGQNVGSCSSDATKWCIAGAIDCVVKHDEVKFHETWTELCNLSSCDTQKLIKRFQAMSQHKAIAYLEKVLGIPKEPTAKTSAHNELIASLDLALGV